MWKNFLRIKANPGSYFTMKLDANPHFLSSTSKLSKIQGIPVISKLMGKFMSLSCF